MVAETTLIRPERLKLYEAKPFNAFDEPQKPKTPNELFGQRYKRQVERFGSPFLELVEPLDAYSVQVLPITINIDFFAAVLGGRADLGHSVVYFEPDMLFYYLDTDDVYKATTADKLANQYRALLMKCCQDMPANVHKLNLVHEWRSDNVAKQVVNRAKSILAADSSFFSATSNKQRIRGIELHERLARRFVDELLTSEPGQILKLQDAYTTFCSILKKQELNQLKRSDFKAIVTPLIRDQFNIGFRNDLVVDGRAGTRGWKNMRLQAMPR
jgi:hypothetical protein